MSSHFASYMVTFSFRFLTSTNIWKSWLRIWRPEKFLFPSWPSRNSWPKNQKIIRTWRVFRTFRLVFSAVLARGLIQKKFIFVAMKIFLDCQLFFWHYWLEDVLQFLFAIRVLKVVHAWVIVYANLFLSSGCHTQTCLVFICLIQFAIFK